MAATTISLLFINDLSLYLVLLIPLTLLISLLALNNRNKSSKKLPPSPPGLPLIGNLHQLSKLAHRPLRSLSEKYGPGLMLVSFGHVPTLVVSSAASLGEIVRDHDIAFSNRPKITVASVFGDNIGFLPYGEEWKRSRKVCVAELLSHRRVQSFQFVREEEAEALVRRIRQACADGEAVNLSQMMTEASNEIVSRCVIGQSYRAEDGCVNEAAEIVEKLGFELATFCVGDFFPWLRWVDVLRGIFGRLRSRFREAEASLNHVIEEHKAKGTSDSSDGKDFVDNLLRLQQDGSLGLELTRQRMIAIIEDVFVGGLETTSTVLVWLMAELLRNPRVMKKAQDEVRRVVGKKVKLDMQDINQMSYLKCIVKETLRLRPPGPLLAPRETAAKVQVRGYEIPANTSVLVNAWVIQRNPDLWDNPEEFIPERFEEKPVDFNGQDLRLIPFGFGRRRCPGMGFALASIECLIANLLYWFDWKLPEGDGLPEDMDMTEEFKLSVQKKIPLYVVPTQFFPST